MQSLTIAWACSGRMLTVTMTCLLSVAHDLRSTTAIRKSGFRAPPRFVGLPEPGRLCAWIGTRSGSPDEKVDSVRYCSRLAYARTYGSVVGASYGSDERLVRIDAPTITAWMDKCCGRYP